MNAAGALYVAGQGDSLPESPGFGGGGSGFRRRQQRSFGAYRGFELGGVRTQWTRSRRVGRGESAVAVGCSPRPEGSTGLGWAGLRPVGLQRVNLQRVKPLWVKPQPGKSDPSTTTISDPLVLWQSRPTIDRSFSS